MWLGIGPPAAPVLAAVIILVMVWIFTGFSARVGIPIIIARKTLVYPLAGLALEVVRVMAVGVRVPTVRLTAELAGAYVSPKKTAW